MSDTISVIVPVYNVEKYVSACIDSILMQSYPFLDIILVDDGSSDQSGYICDSYHARDIRIRVIHKKNGGLSDARNAGIEIATGKYLMFIDSDDTITPDTIERLYTAATQQNCQISVCNMTRVYDDGTSEPFYHPVDTLTVLYGQERFETLKQPSVCNKLFLTELFRNICFPKGKYYEDTFVYHILAYRASAIVLTGHDGYLYLSRRESILGQPKYTDRYFDCVEAIFERTKYLLDHQVLYYSEEACLSLYAAVSTAEKYVPVTETNKKKFAQMRLWYLTAYHHLIGRNDISIKQKIRLMLLRYFPKLHSRLI